MVSLSVTATLLSLVPLVIAVGLYQWQLNRCKDLSIAAARMVLQLVAVGYLLNTLFTLDTPLIGITVLLVMTTVSAWITIRPLASKSISLFRSALVALTISGLLHLAWIVFVVLQLTPLYQPQFIIPLAGMVFANGMHSLSIGAERFESEIDEGRQSSARQKAFNAAMIPQVNALLAVGLVSLPGMMTGQILSGISPLEAVRYQIMVMSMVAGNSALTLLLYFFQLQRLRQ